MKRILGLDVGTSSVKGVLFDRRLRPGARASRPLPTRSDDGGRSEQDPAAIEAACRSIIAELARGRGVDLAAIGLCVHRSSCVLYDVECGRFLSPAILWNDRRATATADALRRGKHRALIEDQTGLPILPYLFGVRARHLLQSTRLQNAAWRAATVDAVLVHRLTGGAAFVTDPTMAGRTQLAAASTGQWDDALLRRFGVPRDRLPEVIDSVAVRGVTVADGGVPAGIPLAATLADQSAAYVGLAGASNATTLVFGTGMFAARGRAPRGPDARQRGVFPLILMSRDGKVRRGRECNDPSSGTSVSTWRRILDVNDDSTLEALARRGKDGPEWIVPAATGIGAPYLRPAARAAALGITAATSREDVARALLTGVAARAAELLGELGGRDPVIAAGGGSASDVTLAAVADLSGREVQRSRVADASARGAAYAAALAIGWREPGDTVDDAPAKVFRPRITASERRRRLSSFREAIERVTR